MLSENIETNIIKYKMFEFNKNKTLKVLITYIKDNEIIEIKKSKVNLKKKNILSKEELADLLINNKTLNNTTYNAYRIMNFNLSLEPQKLENFLGNELFGEDDEKDSDCGSTSESDGEGEGDGNQPQPLRVAHAVAAVSADGQPGQLRFPHPAGLPVPQAAPRAQRRL